MAKKKTKTKPASNSGRPSAKSILAMRFISHVTPMELARRWLQSGDRGLCREARELLEGLFRRFEYSIDIGHLLVLACFEDKREKQAKAVLDKLALISRNPHEEVQSRCGRLYREQGDRYIPYPGLETSNGRNSPSEAVRYYRRALEEYETAYEIRLGHYPGINIASLHFLIAAFSNNAGERTLHLNRSRETASELLSRKETWPAEMPDDAVWHAATEGEARLLLKDFSAAAKCYKVAVEHALARPFHLNAMRKQIVRIVYCYRHQFKVKKLGPFEQWQKWFPEA